MNVESTHQNGTRTAGASVVYGITVDMTVHVANKANWVTINSCYHK